MAVSDLGTLAAAAAGGRSAIDAYKQAQTQATQGQQSAIAAALADNAGRGDRGSSSQVTTDIISRAGGIGTKLAGSLGQGESNYWGGTPDAVANAAKIAAAGQAQGDKAYAQSQEDLATSKAIAVAQHAGSGGGGSSSSRLANGMTATQAEMAIKALAAGIRNKQRAAMDQTAQNISTTAAAVGGGAPEGPLSGLGDTPGEVALRKPSPDFAAQFPHRDGGGTMTTMSAVTPGMPGYTGQVTMAPHTTYYGASHPDVQQAAIDSLIFNPPTTQPTYAGPPRGVGGAPTFPGSPGYTGQIVPIPGTVIQSGNGAYGALRAQQAAAQMAALDAMSRNPATGIPSNLSDLGQNFLASQQQNAMDQTNAAAADNLHQSVLQQLLAQYLPDQSQAIERNLAVQMGYDPLTAAGMYQDQADKTDPTAALKADQDARAYLGKIADQQTWAQMYPNTPYVDPATAATEYDKAIAAADAQGKGLVTGSDLANQVLAMQQAGVDPARIDALRNSALGNQVSTSADATARSQQVQAEADQGRALTADQRAQNDAIMQAHTVSGLPALDPNQLVASSNMPRESVAAIASTKQYQAAFQKAAQLFENVDPSNPASYTAADKVVAAELSPSGIPAQPATAGHPATPAFVLDPEVRRLLRVALRQMIPPHQSTSTLPDYYTLTRQALYTDG